MDHTFPQQIFPNSTGQCSAQYFQYSSRQRPSGRHVFHAKIMYTYGMVA